MTVKKTTLKGGHTKRTFDMQTDVYIYPIQFMVYSGGWMGTQGKEDILWVRDPNEYRGGGCCITIDRCVECGYMHQESAILNEIKITGSDEEFEQACWRWWKARQLNVRPPKDVPPGVLL